MELDLRWNYLRTIESYTFFSLNYLLTTKLHGNVFKYILPFSFAGPRYMKELNIAQLKIEFIASNAFSGLTVTFLNLSTNHLTEIQDYHMKDIHGLTDLDVMKNRLTSFSAPKTLEQFKRVHTKFCCIFCHPVFLVVMVNR